jgi:DNA invertase Pin-like site-specific DNA recombinase
MTDINKKQKKISKYEILIQDLKNKIQDTNKELWNDVINIAQQTSFIEVKTSENVREYYYVSAIPTNDEWYIVGVKCDNKKNHQIGVVNVEHFKTSKTINAIQPDVFFVKANKIKIKWESTDLTKECLKYKPQNIVEDNNLPCVGYCRLSKANKNSYDRQKNLINTTSNEDGYTVNEFFCETLSGDTPFNKRKEILALIEYCSLYNIKDVYVSEFNRLGRSTKTILDGIKFLRQNGIERIYIILENVLIDENYIVNHYNKLKELCRKAEEDRQNIINRMRMGYDAFIEKKALGLITKPQGRPVGSLRTDKQYQDIYVKEIELLKQGVSYRKISLITGTSINTIKRLNQRFQLNIKNKEVE